MNTSRQDEGPKEERENFMLYPSILLNFFAIYYYKIQYFLLNLKIFLTH